MNNIQEQEIIKLAFYEELEKLANPLSLALKTLLPKIMAKGSKIFNPSTFKAYTSGAKAAFGKGTAEGMTYLKSFANPQIVRGANGLTSTPINKALAEEVAKNTGAIQKLVGTTAREFEFLGKGMAKGNSNRFSTLGKNFVADAKRQVTDAVHKPVKLLNGKHMLTVHGDKLKVTRQLPKFLKNNTIAKKINNKLARDVRGFTASGEAITQKRRLAQLGALAITPVGMLATGVATGDPKGGVEDYAAWKVPVVAGSKMLYGIASDIANPGK